MGVHLRRDLRNLAIVLSGFIILHGTYHMLGYLENDLLAEGVFEPLSAAALIAFGAVYLLSRKAKQSLQVGKI